MKNILCIIFFMFSFISNAQQQVYCELVGTATFSGKVRVKVDFGQENGWNNQLVDANGNKIGFNSMIDGLNYMGEIGWKFVQAYAITHSTAHVYHFLLTKELKEGEKITDGFKTKAMYKEETQIKKINDGNDSEIGVEEDEDFR